MSRVMRPRVSFRHEIPRIRHSRFVASLAPAHSVEEAAAFVAQVRAELADARHHCWAYRLDAGQVYRFDDDGEPGGSAGRPILAQIEGHEVSEGVVVVSRWFGGIKLGVGGLMRAYGGATAAVLDLAPLVESFPMCRVRARFPYEYTGAVQSLLSAQGRVAVESSYAVEVALVFEVIESEAPGFVAALRDCTSGRGRVEVEAVD